MSSYLVVLKLECSSYFIVRNWLKGAIRLCSPEEIEEFQLNKLADEIKMLEKILSAEDQSIGFCHNDLQYGNIMMDEEFKQMTIIVSYLCGLIF